MSDSVQFENLSVVLVATRNPLNIGAVARAMGNFGFRRLRVVNPYEVAFREARSAVGASDLLASAQEFSSVAEAVKDCALVVGTTAARERAPQQRVETLAHGAELIRARLVSQRVAILYGSEKRGLSNEDLDHCHWIMRIPTTDEQPSMNLGQAVAVCLWEIAREPGKSLSTFPLAKSSELERLTELLFESLLTSGYVRAGAEVATREKVRRLIHRLELREEDSEVWLGMIRQILWKLKNPERD